MTSNNQERTAKLIAGIIIREQRRIAARLNKHMNRMPKQRQTWLLATVCLLFVGGLLACVIWPCGKLMMTSTRPTFIPAHIGQSSETARSPQLQPTDSLTIKK